MIKLLIMRVPSRALAFIGFLPLAQSACVDSPPIVLPITNVQIPNGNQIRGVYASVGSPPQNISFFASPVLNDTWIYNLTSPFCMNGTTEIQCHSQRGGLYDPATSTTSKTGLNVYEAGGDPSDTARAFGTHVWLNEFATDDLVLNNVTLKDFPIGMPGMDFEGPVETQANLGLGQNSTLLSNLKAVGLIQSRVYSYWYGINSATSSGNMDGHVVLGGYDQAKVIGPGFKQRLGQPSVVCPSGMTATVSNMVLNFPNGSTIELLAHHSQSACLQLDFRAVMTIPLDPTYSQFELYTGTTPWGVSEGIYYQVPTYPPNKVFNGDLTIGLQSGLSVQFPNQVFVVPDQSVGPSGNIVSNTSSSVVLINPLSGIYANTEPILGKVFFSSTYIMVDLDEMTYTMWPVNATTESNIIPVGGNCSSPASSLGSDTSNVSATHHTSTGTIVGAAVGGAAASILIAALITFFLIQRRRRRQRPQPHKNELSNSEHQGIESALLPTAFNAEQHRPHPPEKSTTYNNNVSGSNYMQQQESKPELPASSALSEMAANDHPELPAGDNDEQFSRFELSAEEPLRELGDGHR